MKLLRLLILALLLVSPTVHAELVVIVNNVNTESIDKAALSNIFLGKTKSLPSGAKIVPVILDYATVNMDDFLVNNFGKTASQFRAYWAKQVFSGAGTPPQAFKNSQEIVELVGRNPDLIGVADAALVSAKVRVLKAK